MYSITMASIRHYFAGAKYEMVCVIPVPRQLLLILAIYFLACSFFGNNDTARWKTRNSGKGRLLLPSFESSGGFIHLCSHPSSLGI